MRPSELIYLDWKNVDLENKFLIVEGAITGKQTKDEETKKLKLILLIEQFIYQMLQFHIFKIKLKKL